MTRRRAFLQPGDVEIVCAGYGCRSSDLVPDAPVPVCPRHLRRVYEFAVCMVDAATHAAGEAT